MRMGFPLMLLMGFPFSLGLGDDNAPIAGVGGHTSWGPPLNHGDPPSMRKTQPAPGYVQSGQDSRGLHWIGCTLEKESPHYWGPLPGLPKTLSLGNEKVQPKEQ